MSRAFLLTRICLLYLRRRMEPDRWSPSESYIRQQKIVPIGEQLKERLLGFFTLYLVFLIAGSILLSVCAGCDLPTAVFEFTSALGTVGLSNGLTSLDLPASAMIIEMFGMILGRLEITIVIVGICALIKRARNLPLYMRDKRS